MAKGLGFADPQKTSPVNPDTQYTRRMRGPRVDYAYVPRRTPFHWMSRQGSNTHMGWMRRYDEGGVPETYLRNIEK